MARVDENVAPLQPPFDPLPLIREARVRTTGGVVDHFLKRLLQRRITKKQRDVLIEVLKRETNTRKVDLPANTSGFRKLIHLIISMPEYQLS